MGKSLAALYFAAFAGLATCLAAASLASPASAQEFDVDGGAPEPTPCGDGKLGCATQELAWDYLDQRVNPIHLDTGWVPSSGPIQLRFGLHFAGESEVSMRAQSQTSWPSPIEMRIPGREGSGHFRVDYGFEITAQMKIDLGVGPAHYRWEGDIPIPFIPEDLRANAEASFDPLLLSGSAMSPIEVSDTTSRIGIIRYDAIGQLISIPGLSGGVAAETQFELTGRYATSRIVVENADPIDMENTATIVHPAGGTTEYGGHLEANVHPEGTITYDGVVHIYPTVYLEIAGQRFRYDIIDIPIHVIDSDRAVVFDDELVRAPLPDIEVAPELDAGEAHVGEHVTANIRIANAGEAPLNVNVRTARAPFLARGYTLTVAPGAAGMLAVDFSPEALDETRGTIVLETNDPDEPVVLVQLRGSVLDGPPPAMMMMTASASDGGCGCHVTGAASTSRRAPSAFALAAGLLTTAWRRRRRSGARPPR